jgi:Rrf2 family protein
MQITRQADYAVRAVLYLAGLGEGGRAPTGQIARKQHVPPSFLAKIVSQLSVAGVLHTSRGARGGVSLARNPSEISLLEVIEVIDGPVALNECVADPDACAYRDDCPVHEIWCEAQADLLQRLTSTNFGTLLARRGNGKGAPVAA